MHGVLKVLHSSMMLSKRIHAVTGDKREKSHLFQRLSIAIQRGNAACIQCCFSETDDIVD